MNMKMYDGKMGKSQPSIIQIFFSSKLKTVFHTINFLYSSFILNCYMEWNVLLLSSIIHVYMGEEDEDGRRIDGKVWSVRVGRLLRYKSIIVQQAKVAKRSSKSRTILYIKQIFYHIICCCCCDCVRWERKRKIYAADIIF